MKQHAGNLILGFGLGALALSGIDAWKHRTVPLEERDLKPFFRNDPMPDGFPILFTCDRDGTVGVFAATVSRRTDPRVLISWRAEP